MRRGILSLAMVLLVAGTAQAVTIRDIIELSRAGLGDEVMLALIEVDGGLFNIDRDTLASLKAAGVSEKVIVALIRSGRTNPPEAPAASQEVPQPDVVYLQQQPPSPTIIQEVAVPVAVPVYIPVPVRSHGRVDGNRRGTRVEPSITAPPLIQGLPRYLTDTPPPPPDDKPVYWGWGGKLRPDAWKPKE